MKSSIPSAFQAGNRSIQAIVDDFRTLPKEGRPLLAQYWNRLKSTRSVTLLTALIKVELEQRFRRGERPTAAEYLALFPDLAGDHDRVISLVYEEFCLLEENDASPTVSEFCNRYLPWRDSLLSQIGYHRELSQIVGTIRPKVSFPEVGDRFVTFRLDSLLGRGGAAQVYLATDDLGPRKVVLKVSPSIGVEPAILARLDHPNIVPILSLAESPGSGLHGICMPYKPGLTLETLLEQVKATGLPRRAQSIYAVRKVCPVRHGIGESGWNDFPVEGTYTEAIAWIGMLMARALAYLHEEGVFHRDIKPANIWLSHRDGPLLFDFNLAHQPNDSEHAQAALAGGTLPYMAPEQLQAFLDPRYWDDVKGAADIYALGLVLRELVTGKKPDLPRADLPLPRAIQDLHDRRHSLTVSCRLDRPDIPPSLDAIILKCLAFTPEDRYKTAADLAKDLENFLSREPLTFAANSSRLEVTVNWSYRRHKWIAIIALLILSGIFLLMQRDKPSADAKIQEGIRLLNSHDDNQWRQAREIFVRLVRDNPQNAEPLLYLGHACSRLKQKEESSLYIDQAFGKKDFEEAIQKSLQRDPDSIPLRMTYSEYLLKFQKKPDDARKVCLEIVKAEPNHFGAQKCLGDVEFLAQNYSLSANYYQTAIRLAIDQKVIKTDGDMRIDLVRAWVMELDNLLKIKPDPAHRLVAENLVKQIGKQLELLKPGVKGSGRTLYTESLLLCLRGAWMGDSAYLKKLNLDEAAALTEFRLAMKCFDEVQEVVRQGKLPDNLRLKLVKHVENQIADLDKRLRDCNLKERFDKKL